MGGFSKLKSYAKEHGVTLPKGCNRPPMMRLYIIKHLGLDNEAAPVAQKQPEPASRVAPRRKPEPKWRKPQPRSEVSKPKSKVRKTSSRLKVTATPGAPSGELPKARTRSIDVYDITDFILDVTPGRKVKSRERALPKSVFAENRHWYRVIFCALDNTVAKKYGDFDEDVWPLLLQEYPQQLSAKDFS